MRKVISPDATEHLKEQAIAAIAEGVVITDAEEPNNPIIYTNAGFERLTGYTFEEVRGRNCRFLQGPATDRAAAATLRAAIKARRACSVEILNYRKDGTPFWNRLSVSPVNDERGRVTHFVGVQQDITASRTAAEALQRSQQQYENLVNSIEGIVWESEPVPPFRFTFVSRQAERALGYPTGQWLMDPNFWADHLHPDDRAWAVAYCTQAAAEKRPHQFEYRMIKADGGIIWLSDLVTVAVEGERAVKLRGIMVDITARRQAEAEHRRSEEKYRGIFNNATMGIYQTEPGGKIITANPTLVRMLGYDSIEELLGLNVSEDVYFEKGERESLIARHDRAGAAAEIEVRWKKKDGTPLWVHLNARAVKDDAGQTLYYDGFAHDITARKLLAEQLRQSQKMEAIGRLAGGVAHDFNNLLTAIIGYSELLLGDEALDESTRQKVQEIRQASERAAALTYQLLAFSRKQVLQPKLLDLNATVSEMARLLERLIGEDVQLTLALAPTLWPVRVDPSQISQVVMNLAVNARDAMPQGGRLTIETANVALDERDADQYLAVRAGAYAMLAVSDTGVGMDQTTLGRIFEPFFTTKEVGKGTGLGLATVHGIVAQSGGGVSVSSAPGRGTTFRVYLPRAGSEPVAPSSKQAATELPRGAETILLVEDEEVVRTLAKMILASCGYEVLEAADGNGALEICGRRRGAIDLLIVDVVMPRMSGRELANRLAALCPGVKVLFMSGYTDDAIIHYGVMAEGLNFIQKPFPPHALARKVRELLDKS